MTIRYTQETKSVSDRQSDRRNVALTHSLVNLNNKAFLHPVGVHGCAERPGLEFVFLAAVQHDVDRVPWRDLICSNGCQQPNHARPWIATPN